MILVEFCALRLLGWTDLGWTPSLVVIIPVLARFCICGVAILLVISNPVLFKKLIEIVKSIPITCV